MAEAKQKYLHISDENQTRFIHTIRRLIERKRTSLLQRLLEQVHPTTLATLWHDFSEPEQSLIINTLYADASAELLSELNEETRTNILKSKDTEWITTRLEELESDDVVDILKGMSQWEADSIIRRFDQSYSAEIKKLLQYAEETAGALMSSDFLAVSKNAKLETIIKQFRKYVRKEKRDEILFIYVADKANTLLGFIPIRDLILEDPEKTAKEVMIDVPITVEPDMDQEEVAKIFRDYNLISIPVVNADGVLLGRISVDDIVDVLEDEASEDVYRMAGLGKSENLTSGIATSLKSRLPWMFINLVTTAASAAVVSAFTDIVRQFVILAVFMPMIAAFGGATGNQMVAIVVRGLALNELRWKQVRWILFREVSAVAVGSIIIGTLIGLVASQMQQSEVLGFIVAAALMLNMVIATIIGASIPFLLKLFGLDPALGSSVLVAAITDIMGFFIFLGLASQMLPV